MDCDICGDELTEEENKVAEEMIGDTSPCYCLYAKELCELRKRKR